MFVTFAQARSSSNPTIVRRTASATQVFGPAIASRVGSDPRAPVAIRVGVFAFEPLGNRRRLQCVPAQASRPGAAGQ